MNQEIIALQAQQRELSSKLNAENYDEVVAQMRVVDAKITAIRTTEQLKNINSKQNRLRALASELWALPTIPVNIVNSDGSFHSAKVKKYPELASMKHLRVIEFSKDGSLVTKLSYNGEKFNIMRTHYNNGSTTYSAHPSFEEFLTYHNITAKEITAEEITALNAAIEDVNKKLRQAIEDASQSEKKLNAYFYHCIGVLDRRNEYVYNYQPSIK